MKFVIVGGGAAGWLTALYLEKTIPYAKITLIESEDIGILGAGEGSVPALTSFLKGIDISEVDMLQQCNATFKLGISFENWTGDGSKYMHGFKVDNPAIDTQKISESGNILSGGLPDLEIDYGMMNLIANDYDLNDALVDSIFAYKNKSPYVLFDNKIDKAVQYSYHFDASLFAKHLRNTARDRGVKRIEGEVQKINSDKEGNITSVEVNKKLIEGDFFFDCSGFNRLLLGKHFGVEWKSYTDKLKLNTAIPFHLENENDTIQSYTQAIAMKYGWMWKIPLQNRMGCGYIFDKNYISVDEAKKEVEEFLGKSINVNKVIPFEAGRFENVWVKNCIGVGLSAGFTEPLEATSLWVTVVQLETITRKALTKNTQFYRDELNNYMASFNDSVVDFLHFHYMGKRSDTEFWKTYPINNSSEQLSKKLNSWKYRTPNILDNYLYDIFHLRSWTQVGYGLGVINKDLYKEENSLYKLDINLNKWLSAYKQNIEIAEKDALDQTEFINYVKDNKIKSK